MSSSLVEAMANLDQDAVLRIVKEQLKTEDAGSVLSMLNEGIQRVGEQFERGQYFLADLVVSGMIYKNAMELFHRSTAGKRASTLGRVVIGVAENDIHDIGKDIICDVLRVEGFEVVDLGVDVSSSTFVEAVRTYEPDVVALSGVMRFSLDAFKEVVQALREAGLRDKVAVVIGGNCITPGCAGEVGADHEALDPDDTVQFCRNVVRRKHGEE